MKSQVTRWLISLILAAFLSSFAIFTITVFCEDSPIENADPILVPLDALPELYSDSKLPRGLDDEANRCFPLLGCIETLPISASPEEPLKMCTEFSVYGENSSVVVDYKPAKNCLVNNKQCETFPYDLNALLDSSFNPNNPTIVVTRGYFTREMASWQYKIRDVWKKWTNVNVILVRWPGGNSGLYPQAVANTKIVARQITVFLYYLARLNKLQLADQKFLSKIYLVGHSLGAHISGFVGKDLNGEVGRITGLDPAGPSFVDVKQRHRLDRGDAQLVEAIHTNGGQVSLTQHHFGLLEPIGHIDYYANDGKHQPGCFIGKDIIGCSHKLAPHYYVAILEHQFRSRDYFQKDIKVNRLSAFRADSFEDFDSGSSLLDRCPKSALDESSALDDLNKCTLPMDFFASPGEYRKLLKDEHGLDLDQQQVNLAYFYTNSEEPYVGHHGITRVKVRNLTKDGSAISCDLRFNLILANGQHVKREVKRYNVVSDKIVLPYLLFSINYPYELEMLDNNDFFLNFTDSYKTQQTLGIKRTLIKTVEISGLRLGSSGSRSGSSGSGSPVLKRFKELFALARNADDDTPVQCDFLIETINTQPLKRMHRYIVAWYTAQAYFKDTPDVVVLKEAEELPIIDVIDVSPESRPTNSSSGPEVFIDTVYLGPRKRFVR